ncbi:MAG: hypothetical protein QXT45_06600 [Candidatus Bilamarchaeaceae archaeon]
MIVTTSRYASRETREFARQFAEKNKGRYVSRCKKTVHDLIDFLWRKGESRLLIVEEREKKPSFINEIEIDHWKRWKWGKRYGIEKYEGKGKI